MRSYLSCNQTARKFNLSAKTIHRMAKAKKIPFVKIGSSLRFPADLLDEWARNPDLVASRWFAEMEVAERTTLDST